MAMKKVIYSKTQKDTLYTSGRLGVWQSVNGGKDFIPMDNGYPSPAATKDTNCLLLNTKEGEESLYAGNPSGLFSYDFFSEKWRHINLPGSNSSEVKDIIQVDDHLLVFTRSSCFQFKPGEKDYAAQMPLTFNIPMDQTLSMTQFMLRIHEGTILGLPGKLFVDALGLVLIFLSLSPIVLWYLPWRRKKFYKHLRDTRVYRFFYRHHLKLGIYSILLLLIITLTGTIIRRPFRHIIVDRTVPLSWVKLDKSSRQMYPGIRRAIYLDNTRTLILSTRTGFFTGPADFSKPFKKLHLNVPVSGMGVNVLELLSKDRLLIGSFKGLYIKDIASDAVVNAAEQYSREISLSKESFKDRAIGAAVHNGELQFWVDYRRGIMPVNQPNSRFTMPKHLEKSDMSLWRYLRNIHNGNIFRDLLGRHTWLIIPVGGLLLLVSLLSGTYDWLYRKKIWSNTREG